MKSDIRDLLCEPMLIARTHATRVLDMARTEIASAQACDAQVPEVNVQCWGVVDQDYHPEAELQKEARALNGDDKAEDKASLIAVVPVSGVVTRFGYAGWSGSAPGTQEIGRHIQALDADPRVYGIILSVNTPGGAVTGTPELAEIIHNVAKNSETRIVTVTDSMMASAGEWIGSAAEEVYAIPSAIVGSIGVIYQYPDYSKMLENAGIKYEIIRTPDKKARFTSVEPMDDDMRATIEEQNQEIYEEFVSSMAKFRGVTEKHVRLKFGGGEVMTPAEAVDAGLIDGHASVDQVVGKMLREMHNATISQRKAAAQETERLAKEEMSRKAAAAKAELEALISEKTSDEDDNQE